MPAWDKNNRAVCIIPSRMGSTRFPGKPMADIDGKPMIQRVYEQAANCACIPQIRTKMCIKEIFIATSDKIIMEIGIPTVETPDIFKTGTDRVAWVADKLNLPDDDIVLNIQGDHPVIHPSVIFKILDSFCDHEVEMATAASRLRFKDRDNPNMVKVLVDNDFFATAFSREYRDGVIFEHIGIYAYRVSLLKKLAAMPQTENEKSNSLEQLRAIDNGHKIKVVVAEQRCPSVNVPEDLNLL